MKNFKELYEKRRTRIKKEETTHEEIVDITPKTEKVFDRNEKVKIPLTFKYIPNEDGEYCKCNQNAEEYCKIKDIDIFHSPLNFYVQRVDGKYWNFGSGEISIPIKHYTQIALTESEQYETVIIYKEVPYTGDKITKTEIIKDIIETPIRDNYIVGTSLAVFASIWELCLTSKFIWTWFIGLVTDGYWMVFTTPFAWFFWILATIIYLPLFFILSSLIIASVIWTYTFELTGSVVNKEHPYIPNPFRDGY
jgi:hypothetical protein